MATARRGEGFPSAADSGARRVALLLTRRKPGVFVVPPRPFGAFLGPRLVPLLTSRAASRGLARYSLALLDDFGARGLTAALGALRPSLQGASRAFS